MFIFSGTPLTFCVNRNTKNVQVKYNFFNETTNDDNGSEEVNETMNFPSPSYTQNNKLLAPKYNFTQKNQKLLLNC